MSWYVIQNLESSFTGILKGKLWVWKLVLRDRIGTWLKPIILGVSGYKGPPIGADGCGIGGYWSHTSHYLDYSRPAEDKNYQAAWWGNFKLTYLTSWFLSFIKITTSIWLHTKKSLVLYIVCHMNLWWAKQNTIGLLCMNCQGECEKAIREM